MKIDKEVCSVCNGGALANCFKCDGRGWIEKKIEHQDSTAKDKSEWLHYKKSILDAIDAGYTSTNDWRLNENNRWIEVQNGRYKGRSFTVGHYITRIRVEHYLNRQKINYDLKTLDHLMAYSAELSAPDVKQLIKSSVVKWKDGLHLRLTAPNTVNLVKTDNIQPHLPSLWKRLMHWLSSR